MISVVAWELTQDFQNKLGALVFFNNENNRIYLCAGGFFISPVDDKKQSAQYEWFYSDDPTNFDLIGEL